MPRPTKDGLFKQGNSPYWYCRWHDASGNAHRKSTGQCDYQTALMVFKSWQINAGIKPVDTIYVTDVLDIYHRERGKNIKSNGYAYAIQQLKNWFTGVEWQRLGLKGDIKRISKYIEYRQQQGVSVGTINKEVMFLSAAANIAIDDGWDIKNHAAGKKLTEPKPNYHWLTPAQGRALLHACQYDPTHKHANPSPHLFDYVVIALGTGMRTSEILSLTRANIDMQNGWIRLNTSKADKPHLIPMSDDVSAAVQRCMARSASPWLFYNPQTQTRVGSIRLQLRSACKRAGITVTDKKNGVIGIRGYDTRHTFATWLLQSGATLEQIGDMLNHADPRTTKRYAHHSTDGRKAVLSKLPKL